jgi:protein phosphatase
MNIEIPAFCLVALIGASGSGKSTFAARHFKSTEVLSSDFFRGLVSDDEQDQSATPAAFDSLYYVAGKRLDAGRLTVIDATNAQKTARASILRLAKEQNCFSVAIVLDLPPELCLERNRHRPERAGVTRATARQSRDLRHSLKHLGKEGFRYVHVLRSQEEVDAVEITRVRLWNDRRDEHGPFDVIGDIHGCYDELCALLEKLGYAVDKESCLASPPMGRKAVFLGDLCDRGPENIKVLQLVMAMTEAHNALCLPGNHDTKLLRALRGVEVSRTHGLDITLGQLKAQPPEFSAKVKAFLESLVSHYVLDDGKLVVAHAGLKEKLQGRSSGAVRDFCLYGETTGESDEFGLPVRHNWAEEYRGKALVLYGHVPALTPRAQNNTIGLDTGCVFGGKLTACCYPEKTLVEISASREYYHPVKPLRSAAGQDDTGALPGMGDVLNIKDVLGRRYINTRLCGSITIPEENAAAALESMGRFAADPRWLLYLPPTMSPCETSALEGYLEYPLEAFNYYKKQGVQQLVCEEKHMGSRAIIVLCRDKAAANPVSAWMMVPWA